jgi:hypothetical protein
MADVSASFRGEYAQTSFDEAGAYSTPTWPCHVGSYAVDGPLWWASATSATNVQVVNADGVTPDGVPYFDFTDLIAGGAVEPGEATGAERCRSSIGTATVHLQLIVLAR